MRRFNPDRELYKIKYGNRNKIIISICLLLLVGVMGYSFALYQVRHTRRIIYTTVSEFSNKDIQLAVYYDGNKQDDFPKKNTGYVYEKTICENNTKVAFNSTMWQLDLHASGPDKCDVYFIRSNEPNVPELFQGLVPVTIESNGTMKVADLTGEWYDYDAHKWANAVLVNTSDVTIKNKYFFNGKLREGLAGTEVLMDEVLQMYVWIPRYKYELFNAEFEAKNEQIINIEFEQGKETTGIVKCNIDSRGVETCENAINGNWYTHPAFTFGDTELTGIWFGKFEASGSTSLITIKPNLQQLILDSFGELFKYSREIENNSVYNLKSEEIDTHIMKNMEWGAVAYLTQSKYGRYNSDGNCISSGCEVWINNVTSYITGYAGSSVSATSVSSANSIYQWYQGGVHASTTDNVYGIYDMSGGLDDLAMGFMVNSDGVIDATLVEFTEIPNEKYYDLYSYSFESASENPGSGRGHLGDATREVIKNFNSITGGWYGDYIHYPSIYNDPPYRTFYYFRRGHNYTGALAGIFSFGHAAGSYSQNGFRVVLTAQDGVD